MRDNIIVLTRGHGFEMGTFGQLEVPGGFSCLTCELPWRGNRTSISCIPPGVYELELRNSEVVRRTTGGQYAQGWEVTDVPGRSYIMFHPGNTIDDTEGCILPGELFGGWPVGDDFRWAVTNSRATFGALMEALGARDHWLINVRYFYPEYP